MDLTLKRHSFLIPILLLCRICHKIPSAILVKKEDYKTNRESIWFIYLSSTTSHCLGFLVRCACSFHWAVSSHGRADVPKAFLNAAHFCKVLLKIDCLKAKFYLQLCYCIHPCLIFKQKGKGERGKMRQSWSIIAYKALLNEGSSKKWNYYYYIVKSTLFSSWERLKDIYCSNAIFTHFQGILTSVNLFSNLKHLSHSHEMFIFLCLTWFLLCTFLHCVTPLLNFCSTCGVIFTSTHKFPGSL